MPFSSQRTSATAKTGARTRCAFFVSFVYGRSGRIAKVHAAALESGWVSALAIRRTSKQVGVAKTMTARQIAMS